MRSGGFEHKQRKFVRIEVLEGRHCLPAQVPDQVAERRHSRRCGMMGHCVESGYGLVQAEGTDSILLLDAKATPQVLEALKAT